MVQWVFSNRSRSGFPVTALSAMLGCGDGGDLCAGTCVFRVWSRVPARLLVWVFRVPVACELGTLSGCVRADMDAHAAKAALVH